MSNLLTVETEREILGKTKDQRTLPMAAAIL